MIGSRQMWIMLLLAAAAFAVPVEQEPQSGGEPNGEVLAGCPGMATVPAPTTSSSEPATEEPTLMADCFTNKTFTTIFIE